jgi:uncharacterized membrane protein (TIGR02234 family)
VPLPGSTLVPAELPLALMAVAGVAVAATSGRMARGALRMAAALLTALAGVAVSVLAIRVGVSPAPAVRTVEAARQALATAATDRSAAPVLTAIGGTALAAAGLVALLVRRSWPGLAARYERDPERTVARPAAPASTWEALDRGDDPTADAGTGAADAPRKSVEHSD